MIATLVDNGLLGFIGPFMACFDTPVGSEGSTPTLCWLYASYFSLGKLVSLHFCCPPVRCIKQVHLPNIHVWHWEGSIWLTHPEMRWRFIVFDMILGE